MKNLFSINKSDSDGSASFDDNPYMSKRVSAALQERMDHAFDILSHDSEPAPLSEEQIALKKKGRILWLVGILTLVAAIGLFALGGEAMETWMVILQFTLLLVSIVTTFIARRTDAKLRAGRQDSLRVDFDAAGEELNAIAEEAARELGVPRGALSLEVLPYQYKMAGDRAVPVGKKNHFDNISTSAWIEGDALCLATARELFRIPLASIRGTRTIDEEYEIDFWLKEEACDSAAYKEFNIRSAGMLGKKSRGFCAVELDNDFEFYIPGYDRSVFVALTQRN